MEARNRMACLGAVLGMAGEWGMKGKRGQSQGARGLIRLNSLERSG